MSHKNNFMIILYLIAISTLSLISQGSSSGFESAIESSFIAANPSGIDGATLKIEAIGNELSITPSNPIVANGAMHVWQKSSEQNGTYTNVSNLSSSDMLNVKSLNLPFTDYVRLASVLSNQDYNYIIIASAPLFVAISENQTPEVPTGTIAITAPAESEAKVIAFQVVVSDYQNVEQVKVTIGSYTDIEYHNPYDFSYDARNYPSGEYAILAEINYGSRVVTKSQKLTITEPIVTVTPTITPNPSPSPSPSPSPTTAPTPASFVGKTYYIAPWGNDSNAVSTKDTPFKTLKKVNSLMVAGDGVYLRGGEYAEAIAPVNSGTASKYITYKAYPEDSSYNGLKFPLIALPSNASTKIIGIVLDNRSYINIDGIHINGRGLYLASKIKHFATISGGSYNVIQNSNFYQSEHWGVVIKDQAHHNKILNNTISTSGTWDTFCNCGRSDHADVVIIRRGSHHNLVAGNKLSKGGHGVLRIEGRNNVIQDNILDNKWGEHQGNRSGELVDSKKDTDPESYRGGYNLFERNILRNNLPASDSLLGTSATKVDGTGQIFRKNILYDNHNVSISTDAGSSSSGTKNRIFHNVIYNSGGAAWHVMSYAGPDNIYKNNIAYMHRNTAMPCYYVPNDLSKCLTYDRDVKFNSNPPGTKVIANSFYKFGTQEANPAVMQSSTVNSKNMIAKPLFASADPMKLEDFKLLPGSPQIDKGDFLTQTAAAGSGTTLKVLDAGYFCDGFEMVPGDMIQLQSTNVKARVLKVDYATHTLTLDRSISWSANQGVALEFIGQAPDIGAFD